MKTKSQPLLILLLIGAFILPPASWAQDPHEEKVTRAEFKMNCGVFILMASMIGGVAASGGVVGASLSREQGWFESNSAYARRMEELRRSENPLALLALIGMAGGAAVAGRGFWELKSLERRKRDEREDDNNTPTPDESTD